MRVSNTALASALIFSLTICYGQIINHPTMLTSEQQQAKDEMTAIKSLTDKMHPRYPLGNSLTKQQKIEIAKRSLRAWSLDPLCEPAAYFACQFYLELVDVGISNSHMASKEVSDVLYKLCYQYFQTFGDKISPQHYYNLYMLLRFTGHESQLTRNKMIFYAKSGVCELAHMDIVRSRAHAQLWENLERYVLKVSEDNLKTELLFWQKFYVNEYLPAYKIFLENKSKSWGEILGCWELIEATFYARMHNPQQVRALLQSIANKYPAEVKRVWAVNKSDARQSVSELLKLAGDPQWNTWMPKFTGDSEERYKLRLLNGLVDYLQRFDGKIILNPDTAMPKPLRLPVDVLVIPRITMHSNSQQYQFLTNCLQPCGVINDEWMLFIAPVLYDLLNSKSDFILCVSKRKTLIDKNSPVCENLEEVPWPEYPMKFSDNSQKRSNRGPCLLVLSYYAQPGRASDDWTLWVGTRYHGLAKITHETGAKWGGRWYTIMDGLPSKSYISNIYNGIFKGKRGLILHVEYDYPINSEHAGALFFLDVSSDKLYLVKDGIWRSCQIEFPERNLFQLPITITLPNHGYYFSDNHSMNSFADFLKDDIAYLENHDIADATITNTKAHFLSLELGISRRNKNDKFLIRREEIMLYDKEYKLKTIAAAISFSRTMGNAAMVRTGILFYPPRPLILGKIEAATPYKDMVCMVVNYNRYQAYENDGLRLLFWQPGNSDNPFDNDKWYGPFVWNGCQLVTSLLPDDAGYIWMTLGGKEKSEIFRIDVDKAVESAKKMKMVHSSRELFDYYCGQSVNGTWRQVLRLYLANGQMEFPLESLEKIIMKNSTSKNQDYFDAIMLKAAVFSTTQAHFHDSINCYLKILKETQLPEYQYLANRNLAMMYFNCGDYEKSVETFAKIPLELIISQHYRKEKGFEVANLLESSINNDTLKYYSNQALIKMTEQKKKSSTSSK